jgi:hypothetical protein
VCGTRKLVDLPALHRRCWSPVVSYGPLLLLSCAPDSQGRKRA